MYTTQCDHRWYLVVEVPALSNYGSFVQFVDAHTQDQLFLESNFDCSAT